MLTKTLIEFGLNEKEARIYVALLELEIAPVQEISRHTEINRSTIYVVLESLIKKGLVSISDDKDVRQYIATSPDILLHTAENMVDKQENILNKIEKILPELKALHKDTKQKPKVRVFEGKEGLISAFEETLKTKEKLMRVISATENLREIMGDYMPQYLQKRYQLNIKMHGIHPDNEFNRNLLRYNTKNLDKPILIPPDKYKISADLVIYDNKIAYASHDHGGIAISVESKEMADVMKSVFDLAWEEAKRLGKNSQKNNK